MHVLCAIGRHFGKRELSKGASRFLQHLKTIDMLFKSECGVKKRNECSYQVALYKAVS